MLSESNKKTFFNLIKESSIEEIIWMCGYMSGLLSSNTKKSSKELNKEEKITLVYGTETGNAKNLAFDIYQKAKNKKLQMKLMSLDQYRLQDLEKEDYLFVIISTHGEGEPPSSAKDFFDFIHENQKINLNHLKYSVLALGDKSYSYFCKAGVDVDKRLNNIGAIRIVPLHKCDVDYEEKANKWFLEILNFFQKKNMKKIQKIEGKKYVEKF
ncbi:flavodoxin domain-containing protein [Blattabacterium cuenoti]|uniref:flavodoxin domain-containing protein n=1 Tax=Blattabacterium cuenoti TaxID=1653831 RepID=UPI001EECA215|nr:flavodoxin domain-containing protein [Blattabacterium cuenoti]